ncbi:DUF106 domain-containing protein [Candidatus Woesearchaeota archaeon]|nr:DUF106 domain-containing protein [Candidatus Woesearchaeota archaeon]
MVFDGFFNGVFGFLLNWEPVYSISFISFIITLIVTIAYKYLTDQQLIKRMKDEMKELNKEMKELKDDPKRMMEKQKIVMEKNLKLMGHTLKPSLYTLIPLLIIFSWLKDTYTDSGKILFGLSWIWIYIISSLIFSIVLRKILRVH